MCSRYVKIDFRFSFECACLMPSIIFNLPAGAHSRWMIKACQFCGLNRKQAYPIR